MPALFWVKGPLKDQNRFKVAVFCYVNGLPLHLLVEWMELRKHFRDDNARRHLEKIWEKFDSDPVYRAKYWSYNIPMGVRMYCNGETHYY